MATFTKITAYTPGTVRVRYLNGMTQLINLCAMSAIESVDAASVDILKGVVTVIPLDRSEFEMTGPTADRGRA